MKLALALALAVPFVLASTSLGGPDEPTSVPPRVDMSAKVTAALALAEAEFDVERKKVSTAVSVSVAIVAAEAKHKATPVAAECCIDLDVAKRISRDKSMPLVLWVGLKCENSPAVRDGLPDAVHCHQPSFNRSDSPRLVAFRKDGTAVSWTKELLTADAVASIRSEMSLPAKAVQPLSKPK